MLRFKFLNQYYVGFSLVWCSSVNILFHIKYCGNGCVSSMVTRNFKSISHTKEKCGDVLGGTPSRLDCGLFATMKISNQLIGWFLISAIQGPSIPH
jgi:hypothetical protein